MTYFGRVFVSSRQPNSNSYEFNGLVTDYEVDYDDEDRKIKIQLNADRPQDNFQVQFNIFATGNTTVTINSNNRQSIQYDGKIKPLQ